MGLLSGPMNDSILGYVIGMLDEHKGHWPAIAQASGVPYRTVQKIGSGKVRLPRIDNLEKLARHFRELPQQAA
jgi:predicted transcriptional regulator